MPRRPRIEIPGGTYYLLQATSRHQPLFLQEDDYTHLAALLASAVRRTGTRVFAYCWLPHALHLAVQTGDTRISRFMQGFTSRYARHVHSHTRDRGHLFAQRFESLLIDPDVWLPALVRYIHHAAVRAGCADAPQAFRHSSHGAYTNRSHCLWLHIGTPLRVLHEGGVSSQAQRDAYFNAAPTAEELDLFGRNGSRHTRILGDAEFTLRLPRAQRPSASRTTLSHLIDAVAITQNTTRQEILSLSRRRAPALARSLVAWHAIERRIATLTDVARVLRRDPSTLSKAIARHRGTHRALFRLDALSHLVPLA